MCLHYRLHKVFKKYSKKIVTSKSVCVNKLLKLLCKIFEMTKEKGSFLFLTKCDTIFISDLDKQSRIKYGSDPG